MKIFYSWQSDSPRARNQDFIKAALDEACREINNEDSVIEALRFESAMEGQSGTPEVAATLFNQISEAHAFVADVTLVGHIPNEGNPSKKVFNPNVNLELGFAAGVLGWDRIICVMNESDHSVEELPFDIKNRRYPIRYALKSGQQKTKVSEKLKSDLKTALISLETGTLNRVEEAIRRMDQSCFQAVRHFASAECFATHPIITGSSNKNLQLANTLIEKSITRLLDLGLAWTDYSSDTGLYAYHWTYLGKKVIETVTGRTMKEIRNGKLQVEAFKKMISTTLNKK